MMFINFFENSRKIIVKSALQRILRPTVYAQMSVPKCLVPKYLRPNVADGN